MSAATERDWSPAAVGPDAIYFHRRAGPHAFLSNMAEGAVRVRGVEYPSAEHAFQGLKMLRYGRVEAHARVLAAETPAAAKRRGGKRGGADLGDDLAEWDAVGSREVMLEVLRAKFRPGGALAARLLATGDRPLVERLPRFADKTWGVGKGERGENRLGVLLMRVRDELRDA